MSIQYSLTAAAVSNLDSLVDRIEAKPGDLINACEFEERQRDLNVKAVIDSLPEGFTEEDLIGILRLALLTECATESYATAIRSRAKLFNADWLSRFNDRVWTPDELTHHLPYKLMLMNLGFAEEELDSDIRQTRETEYQHYGGDTPVHLTTFGTIQEYLTDNYHGLIAKMLRPAAPEASEMVMRIKRRETLHTAWYRDMTALQLESNPRFVRYVAEQVDIFHMPGTSLVPELQAKGPRWQTMMGADFDEIFRDLFRLMQQTFGSVRQTGELVMQLAAAKNISLVGLPARHIHTALERLGGPGYGIIGEAVLERAGLGYLFKRQVGSQDSAYHPYNATYERIRGLVRSWIASHIPSPGEVVLGAG